MPISTRRSSDALSMATHEALSKLEETLKRTEERETRLQRAFDQAQVDLRSTLRRLQNEAEENIRGLQTKADEVRTEKANLQEQIRLIKEEGRRRELDQMKEKERELRKRIEVLVEELKVEEEERERESGNSQQHTQPEPSGSASTAQQETLTSAARGPGRARGPKNNRAAPVQPAVTARPPLPTPPPFSPSPPPAPVDATIWEQMTIPYTICGECKKRGVDCYRSIEHHRSRPPQPPTSSLVASVSSSSRTQATHTAAARTRSQTLTRCLECKAHHRRCFTIEIPVPRPIPTPRPGPFSKATRDTINKSRKTKRKPNRDPVRDGAGAGPGAVGGSAERRRRQEPDSVATAKRRRLALIEEALKGRENRRDFAQELSVVPPGGQDDVEMDSVDAESGQRRQAASQLETIPDPQPPPPHTSGASTAPRGSTSTKAASSSTRSMNNATPEGEAEWREALKNARKVAHAAVSMERRLVDLSVKYFGEGHETG
ncbi:hypothetical protein EST38_g1540 [Candolleomyces aberdarensis]|uniref:Uncharacterized protein n=1 Tax=Candolleomyces aberdarensis TaxID=2316362 RepID=A0A4V1Q549_9AGAR|nr:hypothetical protein EST38_g1540 [Candolleomyces aberdarensis]